MWQAPQREDGEGRLQGEGASAPCQYEDGTLSSPPRGHGIRFQTPDEDVLVEEEP